MDSAGDDTATLAALGILAFVAADVTHEALGHVVATFVTGGRVLLVTSSYVASGGGNSLWIPAGGGLANLMEGTIAMLTVRLAHIRSVSWLYLLVLVAAFNLLFATAYPAYSGVALFGDWAGVIAELRPRILWRTLLFLIGGAGYYLCLRLLATPVSSICSANGFVDLHRIRHITLVPFLAALGTAAAAGMLNPRGWVNIFTAAVPAAAGSFGFTQIDHFVPPVQSAPSQHRSIICKSPVWIAVAFLVGFFFIAVLGPGIRL